MWVLKHKHRRPVPESAAVIHGIRARRRQHRGGGCAARM